MADKIDIQRTSGALRVEAKKDIFLVTEYDSGNNGTLHVLGNLNVVGDTTTLSSSNLDVQDVILVLNKGETGNGVSLSKSGLQIDRGTASDSYLLWDETKNWTYPPAKTAPPTSAVVNQGLWVTQASGLTYSGTGTNAIRTSGVSTNLSLLGYENREAVVSVEGTVDYDTRVTDPDHIPNKRFVDLAIARQKERRQLKLNYLGVDGVTLIENDTTRLELVDQNVPGYTGVTEPEIRFTVNNNKFVTLKQNSLDVGQIRFTGTNEITMNQSNTKMILNTLAAVGSIVKPDIEVQAPLSLLIDSNYDTTSVGPPAVNPNTIKIYAREQGNGGSGVFFVNSDNVRDELPSKRKAFFASLML